MSEIYLDKNQVSEKDLENDGGFHFTNAPPAVLVKFGFPIIGMDANEINDGKREIASRLWEQDNIKLSIAVTRETHKKEYNSGSVKWRANWNWLWFTYIYSIPLGTEVEENTIREVARKAVMKLVDSINAEIEDWWHGEKELPKDNHEVKGSRIGTWIAKLK